MVPDVCCDPLVFQQAKNLRSLGSVRPVWIAELGGMQKDAARRSQVRKSGPALAWGRALLASGF